ncbi:hypothetical protein [Mycobacteroides chelonae]|uniref:hypothetical protein n=1 Tax=Mycobacteroides chelonae TaxID=1774 RepID=UPI0008A86718|nr:hypothetical protein [Mycobacteroides chelonae]OHU64938.1 hypothetical protein BKG85_04845 [Mycobacteroides chelonae]
MRIALGVGYMLAPRALGRATFGPAASNGSELQVTNRMLGSRELYLGAATVVAARATPAVAQKVLAGAAAADAWDAWAALATKDTSRHAKIVVAAVALTSTALALVTAGTLRKSGPCG